MRDSETKHHTV